MDAHSETHSPLALRSQYIVHYVKPHHASGVTALQQGTTVLIVMSLSPIGTVKNADPVRWRCAHHSWTTGSH